jgi:hypothetical protein
MTSVLLIVRSHCVSLGVRKVQGQLFEQAGRGHDVRIRMWVW